jgi:transposase
MTNGTLTPAVPARARRRTFTAQHKQEILVSYDAAPDGEKGAILHREDLSRIGRELTPWAATRTGHAIRPTPFSGS